MESQFTEPLSIENWKTFSDFQENLFKMWTIQISKENQETLWIDIFCDCPSFLKNMICKHLVGIALRFKYAKAPPEAKNMAVEQKRKCGRSAIAKKALTVQ